MKKKWLVKDKLCSFGKDTVRIELGPQIIELDCTKKNLSNSVTAPHYQLGRIDAFGNKIKLGKKMSCVDWRARIAPLLWKVYQLQDQPLNTAVNIIAKATGDKDAKIEMIKRFIKVNEFKDKDEALKFAGGLI